MAAWGGWEGEGVRIMPNYIQLAAQARRETYTEAKVRAMDAYEIVEWIHRLEDEIEELEMARDQAEASA